MKSSKYALSIIFLFLFFHSSVYAQRGLNIGFNTALIPDGFFGHTLPHAQIAQTNHQKTYFSNGFSNGLTIRYGFNDSLFISTGYERAYRKVKTILNDDIFYLENGEIMDALEIPIRLNYVKKITRKNIAWTNTLGVSLNFLTIDSYKSSGFDPKDPINSYVSSYSSINHLNQNAVIKSLILGSGVEKDFDDYGSIYCGLSVHIQPKRLEYNTAYTLGNSANTTKNNFQASTIKFDIIYYLPWRVFDH